MGDSRAELKVESADAGARSATAEEIEALGRQVPDWEVVAIAGIHALAGWDLKVADGQALETANRAVEFCVGHASATVGFTGWLARPVWNVLVFSADEPPTQRGLVRVDGITGDVIETYAEAIPEGEV